MNEHYKDSIDGFHADTIKSSSEIVNYYIFKGNLDGEMTTYFSNHSIKSIQNFNNGRYDGLQHHFNKNGDTASIYTLTNDTLVYVRDFSYYNNGRMSRRVNTRYYSDSALSKAIHFTNESGTVTYLDISKIYDATNNYTLTELYYRNGKLKSRFENENGKYIGQNTDFFKNGIISTVETLEADQRNGPFKEYYKTGQLKIEARYIEDYLNGEYKEYYKSGQLKYQVYYLKGVLHGKYSKYNKKGKLNKQLKFIEGQKQ